MAIDVVAVEGVYNGSGNPTVDNPDPTGSGTLIFIANCQGFGNAGTITWNEPDAAATVQATRTNTTGEFDPQGQVWTMPNDQAANYTFGGTSSDNRQSGVIVALDDAHDTIRISAGTDSTNWEVTGGATSIPYPGVASTEIDDLIIAIALQQSSDELTGAPSGYTEEFNDTASTPNRTAVHSFLQDTAETETPGNSTWDSTSGAKTTITLAFAVDIALAPVGGSAVAAGGTTVAFISGGVVPVSGSAEAAGNVAVTFTHGTASARPDVQVLWDLDNDGDFNEVLEDVSSDVLHTDIQMGRDWPSQLTGRVVSGTMRVQLKNGDGKYNYFNSNSLLNEAPFSLDSGRLVRAQRDINFVFDPIEITADRFGGTGGAGETEDGRTWIASGSDWTRADDKIAPPGTGNNKLTVDLGAGNSLYMQATFDWIDADNYAGLVYRYTDENNFGIVYIDRVNNLIQHETTVGGVTTSESSSSVAPERGRITIGVEMFGNAISVYLEGIQVQSVSDAASAASVGTGTEYGISIDHNNQRSPKCMEFYVWDGLGYEQDGVLFTGHLTKVVPSAQVNGLDTATIEVEGMLAPVARTTITPGKSIGVTGESPAGVNAGTMVGANLRSAGQLHPPMLGALSAGDTLGSVGQDDVKALTAIRRIEQTERGTVYELNEGSVGFLASGDLDNQSRVATLSDSPAAQYRFASIKMLDWQREIFNEISAVVSPQAPSLLLTTGAASDGGAGALHVVEPILPDAGDGAEAGMLCLVQITSTGQIEGESFKTPPGWTALNDTGQALGREHWYAKRLTAADLGAQPEFYRASTTGGGVGIVRVHLIDNWYGEIQDGVAIAASTGDGEATESAAQAGTHEPPALLVPWGRKVSLFIASRSGMFTDSAGSASTTNPDDAPDGYIQVSTTFQDGTVATADAVQQYAIKHDVVSVEQPSEFGGTFSDFNYLECNTLAVRGYVGAVQDNDSGEVVTGNDLDSQANHNTISTYPIAGTFLKDTTTADTYITELLSVHATPRPLFEVMFYAHSNQSYRQLASTIRFGNKILLKATEGSNQGVEQEFLIEAINHSIGKTKWLCTLTVSPVATEEEAEPDPEEETFTRIPASESFAEMDPLDTDTFYPPTSQTLIAGGRFQAGETADDIGPTLSASQDDGYNLSFDANREVHGHAMGGGSETMRYGVELYNGLYALVTRMVHDPSTYDQADDGATIEGLNLVVDRTVGDPIYFEGKGRHQRSLLGAGDAFSVADDADEITVCGAFAVENWMKGHGSTNATQTTGPCDYHAPLGAVSVGYPSPVYTQFSDDRFEVVQRGDGGKLVWDVDSPAAGGVLGGIDLPAVGTIVGYVLRVRIDPSDNGPGNYIELWTGEDGGEMSQVFTSTASNWGYSFTTAAQNNTFYLQLEQMYSYPWNKAGSTVTWNWYSGSADGDMRTLAHYFTSPYYNSSRSIAECVEHVRYMLNRPV